MRRTHASTRFTRWREGGFAAERRRKLESSHWDSFRIYNPVRFSDLAGVDKIVESVVNAAKGTDEEMMIEFSSGTSLHVDRRDNAYASPEAIVWTKREGATVVW